MRPRLIHPVTMRVERLNRDEMVMDHDAREPIRGARLSADDIFELPAQVHWDVAESPEYQPAGARLNSSGYVLCRVHDMDTVLGTGQRLKRGDHITVLGHMTGLDLYITHFTPAGHYPDQDGASMFKYHFSDRKPVQQIGDL